MSVNGPGRARTKTALVLFALAIVITAILLAIGTANLPPPPAYGRVGPYLFPSLIAAGLCIVGIALLVQAVRGSGPDETLPVSARLDGWAILLIGIGVVGQIALLKTAGFIIASSVLFVAVTAAFGSRRIVRDVVIAVALTGTAYVAFVHGLGLTLPSGILP